LCSRRLVGPSRKMPLRPTPDALRERAFAIIGPAIENSVFLDLFAGCGTVGIEALSRGARRVCFVEKHHAAVALIRKNLHTLAIAPERTRILRRTADRGVAELARTRADFLWADPPFNTWEIGLEAIADAFSVGALGETGLALLECPDRAVITPLQADLEIRREIPSGASRLFLIGKKDRTDA